MGPHIWCILQDVVYIAYCIVFPLSTCTWPCIHFAQNIATHRNTYTHHRTGIPPLVVAAGSFDDLVAICLYTLFISFALPPAEGQSQVYALLKGPLNIVLGVALGALGGLVCCMSKIWNTRCAGGGGGVGGGGLM